MKTVRSVLRVLADDIYSITCDMELQKMDSIVDESLLELQQVLVPEEIKITVMEKCSHEVCPICVDIERAEAWNACRQEVLRRMRGGRDEKPASKG